MSSVWRKIKTSLKSSDPDTARANKDIESNMNADRRKKSRIHSILLLGAGESGKTTLMKQMRHIWGRPFLSEELAKYRAVIWENTIEQMKTLVLHSRMFAQSESEEIDDDTSIDEKNKENAELVDSLSSQAPLTRDVFEAINELWHDPGIQNTYKHRDLFYILDTTEYLFANMERFADSEFIPRFEDFTRLRIRSLGVKNESFTFSGTSFVVYDVGGQRSERKKWFHQFDSAKAVIYVCSLAGFNQVCFEDNKSNKLHESWNVFERYLNDKAFKSTNVILFLNKQDLFDRLINAERVPFVPTCKCDFDGDPFSQKEIIQYIVGEFEDRLEGVKNQSRALYHHLTCATNTEIVKNVFNSLKDILIHDALKNTALV